MGFILQPRFSLVQPIPSSIQNLMRNAILALGVIGCLFFSAAFLASLADPGFVERIAREIIRFQVERKVHEKVDAIDARFLGKKAEALSRTYAGEIADARRQLAAQLPARIAAVIAEMRNLDCQCRKKIETSVREGLEWRVLSATQAQERLTSLIRTKYMETATQLTREFRIFTGSNAVVFAILILAVLVKRRAGLLLLPAALVLLAAALLTGYLYLFKQDWLHTLLFSDYVGLWYFAYLGVAFAFLGDLMFNRGRVTGTLLNWTFNVAGSTTVVLPC